MVLWYSTFNDELRAYESMMVPVKRAILSDEWSHIAVVVEYPRCRFYHNGELVRDAYMPFTGVPNRANVAKQIGAKMSMDLDEFRLYRRALTVAEVAAHAKGEDAPGGPSVELAVEPHWYEGTVALRLTCKGVDLSRHTATMTLLSGDYTEIVPAREASLSEPFPGSGRYEASVTYPLSGLAGRSLDGVARVKTPAGKTIRTVYRHASLKKPEWVDTKEGRSDKVLLPWTPVEAERKPDGTVELRVWGRRHVFSGSPFPREVETQGVNVLAAPIALTGRVGKQTIAWKGGALSLQGVSETRACLEQSHSGGPLSLRVTAEIEYDGYMLFDCLVRAQRTLSLDELTLVIPLRTRGATLGYGDRVLPEDRKIPIAEWFSGAVRGDLAFRFSGNVWLGDEERGLCWQAETDEDWHYRDPQKAIEIHPRGEITTFRAHFVDTPSKLTAGEELRYRFALVATPIKPIVRDSWDLRLMRSEPYGADLDLPDRKTNGKPTLQYCSEAGIRRLFINVNDVWPYPMPVHKKLSLALHRLMDEAHAYGIKLHDYAYRPRAATRRC